MSDVTDRIIESVARRLHLQHVLSIATRVSIRGAWVGVVVAIAFIYCCPGLWRFAALGVAAILPFVAIAQAWRKPLPRETAAMRIDEFYDLKDRVRTALDLSKRQQDSGMATLLLRETEKRMRSANAKQVVPFRSPARALESLVLIVTLVGLVAWPWGPPVVESQVESPSIAKETPGRAINGSNANASGSDAPPFSSVLLSLEQREAIDRYFAPQRNAATKP